jgi:membrane protein DedA with SNARE-associated domain
LQVVDSWIEGGGIAVLFGLLFACGLGLPLPEEIPLMVSGALIANGKMHFVPAAIAAWCGIMGGDMVLYHFGKRFGLEITRVRFIGKHLTKERIEKLKEMFQSYGVFVVGVGRMFTGVRGAMVVAAGAVRYSLVKFLIADGLAAVVSGGFFMFVGHWAGASLNEKTIKKFKYWFLSCAVVVACLGLAWILWRLRRDINRMEKATKTAQRVAQAAHLVPKTTLEQQKHVEESQNIPR